jgi:hypothetical protein
MADWRSSADGAATAPETGRRGRGIYVETRWASDGGCGVEPRAASGEVRPLNSPLIPADFGAQGPNPAMMCCPRRLGGSARRGHRAEGDESLAAQPRVSTRTNRGEQRGAGGGEWRRVVVGRRLAARLGGEATRWSREQGARRAGRGRKTRGARGGTAE